VLCFPFSWLWMLPEDFLLFLKSLMGTALFASNFVFWDAVSYFNPIAEEQPLLHTWSLAVEEQFYIFFPFIFIFFSGRRVAIKTAVLLIFATSLALAEFLSRSYPSFNFYMLPSRAWELMVGSLISLYNLDKFRLRSNSVASPAALIGLVMVVMAVFLYDSGTPFPGVYAILPVAGAALVICFSSGNNLVGRLLSTRKLVAVGLVSYSLYLWHQPLLAFAKIRSIDKPSLLFNCLLLLLSLLLAFLSYRFIERPFRDPRGWSAKNVFRFSATSIGLIFVLGLSSWLFDLPDTRHSERVRYLADSTNFNNPDIGRCRGKVLENSCIFGNTSSDFEAVAWGDSHLDQLIPALNVVGIETGLAIRELAYPGCPPIPGAFRTDVVGYSCQHNSDVLEYILTNSKVRVVIMHSYWEWYYDKENALTREGKVQDALRDSIKAMTQAGKRVILIGPVPKMSVDPRIALAKSVKFEQDYEPFVSTDHHLKNTKRSRTLLKSLAYEFGQVAYVSPMSVLCDINKCRATDGFDLLYRDDNHLSVEGGYRLILPLKAEISNNFVGKLGDTVNEDLAD